MNMVLQTSKSIPEIFENIVGALPRTRRTYWKRTFRDAHGYTPSWQRSVYFQAASASGKPRIIFFDEATGARSSNNQAQKMLTGNLGAMPYCRNTDSAQLW